MRALAEAWADTPCSHGCLALQRCGSSSHAQSCSAGQHLSVLFLILPPLSAFPTPYYYSVCRHPLPGYFRGFKFPTLSS